MAHRRITASGVVYGGPGRLTSLLISPPASPGVSAWATLYNATAATAGTEIFNLHCGTAPQSIYWGDAIGLDFDALFVTINSCGATFVWN